ncbi:ATP-binding cassette domain-containing protein [Spiroplasma alleghenense]|uniref:Cell division transport system ATP-binding protein n=1 Tax=Spiroplasma alleghenense TaxID=216931 RepID=A0A345Z4E3_9MOLU|nr:ATP-binding cassette domain-containing protein [Spiroplasma alleghenense]AXK51472.1 cell division transport system ATP-binding protein [Spiroplasma alleghenense]
MKKLLILNNIVQKNSRQIFYDNISFEIEKGELIYLEDNSDSNLFKIISGQSKFQQGSIFLNGTNLSESSLRLKISHVLDYKKLPNKISLNNYLNYCGRLKSVSKKESDDKLIPLIHYFGLESELFNKIFKLNQLQKFCVTLFVALLNQPELILIEIDFAEFSNEETIKAISYINDLNKTGKTFIVKLKDISLFEKFQQLNFSKNIKIVNGVVL